MSIYTMGTVNIGTYLYRHMSVQQDQQVQAIVAKVSQVYTIEAGVYGGVQVWLLAVYI